MANGRTLLGQVSLFAILAMIMVALAVFATQGYFQEAYSKQVIFERKLNSLVFEVWKNQTMEYAATKFQIYECSHRWCNGEAVGANPAYNISRCLNQSCGLNGIIYYNQTGEVYANFNISYANETVYLNLECLNSSGWDGCFGNG